MQEVVIGVSGSANERPLAEFGPVAIYDSATRSAREMIAENVKGEG
jgi:hypothetical protein